MFREESRDVEFIFFRFHESKYNHQTFPCTKKPEVQSRHSEQQQPHTPRRPEKLQQKEVEMEFDTLLAAFINSH